MIAINELRIGSWIKHYMGETEFGFIDYFQIKSLINPDYGIDGAIIVGPIGHEYEINNCHAVLLTTKILERCGFILHTTYDTYHYITVHLTNTDQWITFKSYYHKCGNYKVCVLFQQHSDGEYSQNIEMQTACESLHQLQNLYYSLTNIELIYKP